MYWTSANKKLVNQVGSKRHAGFELLAIVADHHLARKVTNAQKARLGHIEPGLTETGIFPRQVVAVFQPKTIAKARGSDRAVSAMRLL